MKITDLHFINIKSFYLKKNTPDKGSMNESQDSSFPASETDRESLPELYKLPLQVSKQKTVSPRRVARSGGLVAEGL